MKVNGVGLFLPRSFGAPSAALGSDLPWYFIRQDFFQGVGLLVGLLSMLVIVAATWRRYSFSNWPLLMMGAVWMVPCVVTAIIIYVRCTDLLDYTHAVSAWPTFNTYLGSDIQFFGLLVGFGLALLCAATIAWRTFREQKNLT